ncbi:MAG: VOC family protein [Chitinophagaceae bacterium]|nr:VOC family protein [Chitinophagaceae bacterium]
MQKILLILLVLCGSFSAMAQDNKPQIQLNHIAIYVTDLQKSAAFYREVIGLDSIPEPFRIGKHAWFKIGPAMALHVIADAPVKKEYYKNNHICFSVTNLNQFVQRLQSANIIYEDVTGKAAAITTRTDGVHQIWFRDPDGYWIEVNDAKN